MQFVVEGEHGCAFTRHAKGQLGEGGSWTDQKGFHSSDVGSTFDLFLLFFQSQPTHKNVFLAQTTLLNSGFLSCVELWAGDREPEDPVSQAQRISQEPAELHRR